MPIANRLTCLAGACFLGLTLIGSGASGEPAGPSASDLGFPCPHFGGVSSLEMKAGTDRSLGSATALIPLACRQDRLVFADLRYQRDDEDHREGNMGLGARIMTPWNSIAGAYAFYDRRLSGSTNKYHTQATLGAEWLTQTWEARANTYIPLTDAKSILTGPAAGTALSGPYLAGTGIYVTQTGALTLEEKPTYGFDAEIGAQVPSLPALWAHVAGYRFSAGDGTTLTGARGRLTYDFTKNLALTAEGQWDDERGRQGWLGARLNFAFGGPSETPSGLKARMTTLPVRDVDIVTSAAVKGNAIEEVPVVNIASGDAQRVLYVNNMAAAGGDGSLASPFNTLAAAQAVMQDHDVIYLYAGDGTTAGQDAGITIDKAGVQLIGAGSAFTYDSGRFSISSGNFDGTTLIAAGSNPLITNINAGGHGVSVTGDGAILSGFTVDGATQDGINILNASATVTNVISQDNGRYGIYALANTATAARTFTASDITVSGNVGTGVLVISTGTGSAIETTTLSNILTQTNTGDGIRVSATLGARIGNVTMQGITSDGNWLGIAVKSESTGSQIENLTADTLLVQNSFYGIRFDASSGGDMGTVNLLNATVSASFSDGVYFYANGSGSRMEEINVDTLTVNDSITGFQVKAGAGATVGAVEVQNVTSSANLFGGIMLYTTGAGSTIEGASISDSLAQGNGGDGLSVWAQAGSSLNNVKIERVTTTGNTANGVDINDDTANAFLVDLGGGALGSTGGNRIFGNTGTDINADMDDGVLSAQFNWWGDPAGLQAGERTLDGTSTIDSTNFLTADPGP